MWSAAGGTCARNGRIVRICIPVNAFGEDGIKRVRKVNVMSREGAKPLEMTLSRLAIVPSSEVVDLVLARNSGNAP